MIGGCEPSIKTLLSEVIGLGVVVGKHDYRIGPSTYSYLGLASNALAWDFLISYQQLISSTQNSYATSILQLDREHA